MILLGNAHPRSFSRLASQLFQLDQAYTRAPIINKPPNLKHIRVARLGLWIWYFLSMVAAGVKAINTRGQETRMRRDNEGGRESRFIRILLARVLKTVQDGTSSNKQADRQLEVLNHLKSP
jgi:hypothetical protein